MRLLRYWQSDPADVRLGLRVGSDIVELAPSPRSIAEIVSVADRGGYVRSNTHVPADSVVSITPVPEPNRIFRVMHDEGRRTKGSPPFAYLKHPGLQVAPEAIADATASVPGAVVEKSLALVMRSTDANPTPGTWSSAIFGVVTFLDVVRPVSEFPAGVVAENWTKSWDTPWAVGLELDAINFPGVHGTEPLQKELLGRLIREGREDIPEIVEFLANVTALRDGDLIVVGGGIAHESVAAHQEIAASALQGPEYTS